jgi:hypothetical protein
MPLPIFTAWNACNAYTTYRLPRCGLTLTIETETTTHFAYNGEEWKQLRKHPDLGSPIFCIPSQMLRPPPKRRR